jgi:hypothetical protein
VNAAELVFGGLLVALLLGLGGYYGWGQIGRLRMSNLGGAAFPGEERYFRRQAWRRLVCSGLMILLAGLLVGSYVLEKHLALPGGTAADAKAAGQRDSAETAAVYLFSIYWIVVFLLFLAILVLAIMDLVATRRFTFRQLQHIEDRHQELIGQVARLRSRRDGAD